jgi:hypothetical protein
VSAAPPAGHESNWLPAPTGPFTLSLRLYAPTSHAETTWTPPAVEPTG